MIVDKLKTLVRKGRIMPLSTRPAQAVAPELAALRRDHVRTLKRKNAVVAEFHAIERAIARDR